MSLLQATSWNGDPVAVLVILLALGWTLAGWRRSPDPERRTRALWTGGLSTGLLVVALLSPLAIASQRFLLTAHLLQLLLLIGVVAPLLLYGRPRLATSRRLEIGVRLVTHPVLGLSVFNAIFILWHVPAVYTVAQSDTPLYSGLALATLVASMIFWWPIVQPLGGAGSLSPLWRLGYILLATIPQTFAGITLALAPHPLFIGYSQPGLWGLDPLTDQQVAGAGLALLSKIALFVAFGIVLFGLLRDPDGEEDDGHGGSHTAAPRPWRRPPASAGRLRPPGLRPPIRQGRRSRESLPLPDRRS